MWVDPTYSTTDPKLLEKILNLQHLKLELEQDEYSHKVACFIETLIQNAGYTCLEISSLAKDILKHHKNPEELYNSFRNIDLSHFKNKDRFEFDSFVKMRNAVAEFVNTLRNHIVALLGILITVEDAQASRSSLNLNRFSVFPPAVVTCKEDLDLDNSFKLTPQKN